MATEKKIFDLTSQQNDTSSKVVVGLERISEAFRVLLWEHGKNSGLSPIQIQILIFLKYHKQELRGVSYLAKEFNMTKPTVSDAVKALVAKGLVSKEVGLTDSRSHTLSLTSAGKKMTIEVENFANPIRQKIEKLKSSEQQDLLANILNLVSKLNESDIIAVQRTCYSCKFYKNSDNEHYCNLLKSTLSNNNIRLDCPEFEAQH